MGLSGAFKGYVFIVVLAVCLLLSGAGNAAESPEEVFALAKKYNEVKQV